MIIDLYQVNRLLIAGIFRFLPDLVLDDIDLKIVLISTTVFVVCHPSKQFSVMFGQLYKRPCVESITFYILLDGPVLYEVSVFC